MSIHRAREAFSYTDKQGVPRVITAGSLMTSDDPDFKRLAHLFEPVEAAAARTSRVEQATAAPGEKRSIGAPKLGAAKPAGAPKKPEPKPEGNQPNA